MRRYDNNTQLLEECHKVERLHLFSNAPEDRINGLKLLGDIRKNCELSVSGTDCHMNCWNSPSWKVFKYTLNGHVSEMY